MIRYTITAAELRYAINDLAPTWFQRAAILTAKHGAAGAYLKNHGAIWGEIKTVYMQLQGHKCGFCERRLEHSQFGSIEHDVEHFRPKAKVTDWPPASRPGAGTGLEFPLGAAAVPGYYRLPHHHENYLMSCKTCNSILKGNGFPVAGDRDTAIASPRRSTEMPLLCYPIGLVDTDPQTLIRFRAILPVPAANRGHRRRRGQAIISFFDLAGREGLLRERAVVLLSLYIALASAATPATALSERVAERLVRDLTAFDAAHASCARSFDRLWNVNRPMAEAYAEATLAYLSGGS